MRQVHGLDGKVEVMDELKRLREEWVAEDPEVMWTAPGSKPGFLQRLQDFPFLIAGYNNDSMRLLAKLIRAGSSSFTS